MGNSIGWVFIPKGKRDRQPAEIIKDLFSVNYEEIEPSMTTFRSPIYQNIGEYKDSFVLMNESLALLFFKERSDDFCSKLFDYFDYPRHIFIVIQQDNSGNYGFALIENGKMKRFFISCNHRHSIEQFGEPLPFEQDWLEGKFDTYYDEDEEIMMGTVENRKTKKIIDLCSLEMNIVDECCRLFLGVETWGIDDIPIRYFKLKSNRFFSIEDFNHATEFEKEREYINKRVGKENTNRKKIEKIEAILNSSKFKFWFTFIVICSIFLYYLLKICFK